MHLSANIHRIAVACCTAIILTSAACNAQRFKMEAYGMEGTIPRGTTFWAVATDSIAHNDIVAFDYTDPQNGQQVWLFRAVGLPGDTVQLRKGILYINGRIVPPPPKALISYWVTYQARLRADWLEDYQVDELQSKPDRGEYLMHLSQADLQEVAKLPGYVSAEANLEPIHKSNAFIYQSTEANGWNQDNYGPVIVPQAGTPGVPEDYYFVLGDNRHLARDSRYVGPIPASSIHGTVEIE